MRVATLVTRPSGKRVASPRWVDFEMEGWGGGGGDEGLGGRDI